MNIMEKYMLKEAKGKEFPLDVLKKIERMTDINDHDSARILAAKTMKNKKMVNAYEGIQKVAMYFGHLPKGLGDVRYEIDKHLWSQLKSKYSNGQDVYMAF